MTILTGQSDFPDYSKIHPSGIIAIGGELSVERLKAAYQKGIFPWFNEGEITQWYCPNPRFILYPSELKVSKSMRKIIDSNQFEWTENKAFENVITECAKIKRRGQRGTWINTEMINAYIKLHHIGLAKSIEVWENGLLVGGFYGIDIGHIFCGESMFAKVSNASKFGFIQFVKTYQSRYKIIDCQVYTEHLESLGAKEISRELFLQILENK